jgi:hypothetical protein
VALCIETFEEYFKYALPLTRRCAFILLYQTAAGSIAAAAQPLLLLLLLGSLLLFLGEGRLLRAVQPAGTAESIKKRFGLDLFRVKHFTTLFGVLCNHYVMGTV